MGFKPDHSQCTLQRGSGVCYSWRVGGGWLTCLWKTSVVANDSHPHRLSEMENSQRRFLGNTLS